MQRRYYEDHEEAEVVARSSQLLRQAKFWRVEIPKEYWVSSDESGSFIGALYHDALETKIRNARRTILFQCAALLGVSAAVANFVRGCR